MSTPLTRESIVPLYVQIADDLAAQIRCGALKPMAKLPSELELTGLYNASRVTVRLAVKHLIAESLVASRQGKGTFVLEPIVKYELGEFRGFYDQLEAQGVQPQTELVRFVVDPPKMPAEAWGLAGTGRHIIEFTRLYRTHDHAFAEVHGWFAVNAIPDRTVLESRPVLQVVMQQFGSTIESAELGIRAVIANARLARHLEIKRPSALLLLRRTSRLANGKACEYSEIHIRAERYEFQLKTEGAVSVTSAIHSVHRPARDKPRLIYPLTK
jgi:GntR family transcriptional regulator